MIEFEQLYKRKQVLDENIAKNALFKLSVKEAIECVMIKVGIIDVKSSFADWLNNQNVRNQLKLDIKICLVKNGYPPQYSPEVFNKVMEQVENFEEHSATAVHNVIPFATVNYQFELPTSESMVADDPALY